MKKNSIIYFLMACLSLGMVSCEDMLTPNSERNVTEIAKDTLYSYWGIVKSLQTVAERYVILGECRGELVSGTGYLSDTIQSILDFDMDKATDGSNRYLRASDYYHIINSCNAYLASYDSTRTTGSLVPYMKREAAQVEAIRAWVYLQLVQVYGKVPFYTEPLLTTDAINAFASSHPTATADNLADLLVEGLERAAEVERTYGYPQYATYGKKPVVAHSSKLMIPLNVILGDLFLTKGDAASCARAAQYYHNYLSGNMGQSLIPAGGALPADYSFYGFKSENATQTTYLKETGTPWTETGAQSTTAESVTAIPSSTNKLWGTVLRGVNELFGYDSEISVRTSEEDTTTTSTVTLMPLYYKKQLTASTSYFDLCKAQDFQLYVGGSASTGLLTTDPNVGDARQFWVRDVSQRYSNGITNTEKFVTKQNPYGSFTTVYPMIYRKSQIWLRYAEALCGAGYPSYAFAILKDGLCNASSWLPEPNTSDYAVKDTAFTLAYRAEEGEVLYFPSDNSVYTTVSELLAAYLAAGLEPDSLTGEGRWFAHTYENYPAETTSAWLDYIDQRETQKGGSFLNFNTSAFQGNFPSFSLIVRPTLAYNGLSVELYRISDGRVTAGIHNRGTGYVRLSDRANQVYNYVDMVTKKAKENYGQTLTKADIYSGEYDDIVRKCVEDLIVDEEALELAFEGTRFFDLMRVARRRGEPSYLANKLALRNPALKTKLQNEQNWYFPLPQ